jgi:hypothetical protein
MAGRRLTTRELARQADAAELEPAAHDEEETRERSSAPAPDDLEGREPLLPEEQSDSYTTRWQEIQVSFVDEPRQSVANADALVADLMQRLASGFSNERDRLERQWDSGDDVSTEELRVALTRYRSFFNRLLSA